MGKKKKNTSIDLNWLSPLVEETFTIFNFGRDLIKHANICAVIVFHHFHSLSSCRPSLEWNPPRLNSNKLLFFILTIIVIISQERSRILIEWIEPKLGESMVQIK